MALAFLPLNVFVKVNERRDLNAKVICAIFKVVYNSVAKNIRAMYDTASKNRFKNLNTKNKKEFFFLILFIKKTVFFFVKS